MEQDRGDRRERGKVSLGQWWGDFRPTKTVVFWSWVGAVVLTMIVGFAWGGWVTEGTALKLADDAVVKRLAPMCLAQFNRDPGKDRKLIALKETSSWQGGEYVEKQGWATMAGEGKPDSAVASECAKLLLLVSK